jgi:hypothetical protein
MNNAAEKPASTVYRETTRAIREGLAQHTRQEAELALSLQTALAGERLDEKSVARLLQARCSATREGMMLICRWLSLLERRISQTESRVSDLITRASDHDESLRLVCSVLKEIDDPYGFGLSLDERILDEAAHRPADDVE